MTDDADLEAAMKITDADAAKACFDGLVSAYRRRHPEIELEGAQRFIRDELGYFAGYFGDETRRRVEALFACSHPLLGAIAKHGTPTPAECIQIGIAYVRSLRQESDGEA